MSIEDIISLFLEECFERLTDLSAGLMELERDPSQKELLQDLFRVAHTLKGNASTAHNTISDMDPDDYSLPHMEKMAKITHDMENLLSESRDRGLVLTPERIEVLFHTEEMLEVLVTYIKNRTSEEIDVEDLREDLRNALSPSPPVSVSTNSKVHRRSFSFVYDGDDMFKHPFVSLIYVEIQEKYGIDNVNFTPSTEELMLSKPFENACFTLATLDTDEEIILFIQSLDNVSSCFLVEETPKENFGIPSSVIEAVLAKPKSPPKKSPENTLLSGTNIRVPISRIDGVLKHVSSLVILKNRLSTYAKNLTLEEEKMLKDISEEISQTVDFLQESVMKIRMTPLEQLFSRFPKDVRNIAKEFNKTIRFEHAGGETEIDKSLLDELFDPLMHLIRNSIFHGIEKESDRVAAGKTPTGTLSLSAKHEQGMVVITVEDDGGGINVEAVTRKAIENGVITEERSKTMAHNELVNLIYAAGLSTAKEVNSVAGRGVGMDAVKNKIETMKGTIQVFSETGKGTKTIIRLPLTLAIVQAMLTRVAGDIYAFPLSSVESVETIAVKDLRYIANREVYVLRDNEIPIIRLDQVFNLKSSEQEEILHLMVLNVGEKTIGVTVDEHIGQEDIVVKNIGKYLGRIPGIAGCNILGDGSISLIVDVNSLAKL